MHKCFWENVSQSNFYIDIADIRAAAETKNLHALLKYDFMPHQSHDILCTSIICIDDYHFGIAIANTEDLIQSNECINHNMTFLARYLEHKFRGKILRDET